MDPIHLQDPFGMAATRIVEAAWTEHGPALTAYLTSLTRDPSAAEDIAQEAFLRLTREVGGGRAAEAFGQIGDDGLAKVRAKILRDSAGFKFQRADLSRIVRWQSEKQKAALEFVRALD